MRLLSQISLALSLELSLIIDLSDQCSALWVSLGHVVNMPVWPAGVVGVQALLYPASVLDGKPAGKQQVKMN